MMNHRKAWRVGSATVALALCAAAAWGPGATAAERSVAACSGTDLKAKVTGSAAGMSQPAAYVTVTNVGAASCFVKGYPTIAGAWTKKGKQQIAVTNGAVMNAPESKPKRIVLAPGGHAWFAVGAATAYDPPVVTFTRLSISMAGGGITMVRNLGLQASAPSGQPFPLGVTAYAAGIGTSSE
ncbi:MAG: DUF4232 domain-containing protein [Actinomycetota bacterium]|nr:DUF4232 domain-containing protein [Actinomycetota bacterium]